MGRVTRTARVGEQKLNVDVQSGSTPDVQIPNYGHTVLSTADGAVVVMGAPVEGVVKRLSCLGITTTTATITVNLSTGDEAVSVAGSTASAGIEFSGATDATYGSIELVGISSTRWLVTNIYDGGASTAMITLVDEA